MAKSASSKAAGASALAGNASDRMEIVPAMVEGELRIRDTDLGKRLKFSQPRDIRKIIARHGGALSEMGALSTEDEIAGKGQPVKAYYLNKKQAIFITAKSETEEATEITIEVIERFDAYERGTIPKAARINVRDPAFLLELSAELTRELQEAQGRTEELEAQAAVLEEVNAELQPKANAHDRLTASEGTMSVTLAAKDLGVGRDKLFNWLRNNQWAYHRGSKWHAYDDKLKAKLLEQKPVTVSDKNGVDRTYSQIMVTTKGLGKLSELVKAGKIKLSEPTDQDGG